MKSRNLLQDYGRGKKNFRRAKLANLSFKGANLAMADFRGADIRGTNFVLATLEGANFHGAKAGLTDGWIMVWSAVAIAVSILAGYLAAWAGHAFYPLGGEENLQVAPLFYGNLVAIIIVYSLLIRGDIIAGFWGIAALLVIALIVSLTGFSDIFFTAFAGGIVFLAALGEAIAALIILAISGELAAAGVATVAVAIAPIHWSWTVTVGVALFAFFINWSLLRGATKALTLMLVGGAFIVASGILAALDPEEFEALSRLSPQVFASLIPCSLAWVSLTVGCFLAWRSTEQEKERWLREFLVNLTSAKGTHFRQANLTDTCFVGAKLRNTNFQDAKLCRTRFGINGDLIFAKIKRDRAS